MTGRRKISMHQRKVERPKIETVSTSAVGRTNCRDVQSSMCEKKIIYARAKNFVSPKMEKRYDSRDFSVSEKFDKRNSGRSVGSTKDEISVLRREIRDWKSHEARTVRDKLSKIESGIIANESTHKSRGTRLPGLENTTDNVHPRTVRSESQPEARRRSMMHGGKFRSSCTTRRSAADGQTTGLDKREVVSHVRTRSLDRSSPRVRRTDNPGLPANDRSFVENLKDYMPRKSRKKVPIKLPESPLYSPETLGALDKAEKLIREAQKRILEVSYDVNSGSERELSDGFPRNEKMREDDEALYIRDIVASRFYEANESGRIYTRVSARRPNERLRRPEIRQTPYRPIVEQSGAIGGVGSTIPRHLKIKNNETKIPSKVITEQSEKPTLPKRKDLENQETSKKLSRSSEKSTTTSKGYNDAENHEDRTTGKFFCFQQGPHVDIRNELTTTNLEKIDISPRSSALPLQCNNKTYEFRHETCVDVIPEKDNTPGAHHSSIGDAQEMDEKSYAPTGESAIVEVPSSNRRGSSSDLVENKSGRSIESERLEGRENTRISRCDVRTTSDKLGDKKESFMDFLQRTANNENPLFPNEHCRHKDSSGKRETTNTVDVLDRAVQQFFRDFRRGNLARNSCPVEMDSVDGKLFVDRTVLETSDNSTENELFEDFERLDDNWNLEEINLEPLNLRELDIVLRKFDSTMDEVLRGTRHLGALMSEYSMNETISKQSKSAAANADSSLTDKDKFSAGLSKDISINRDGKAIESDPTKNDLSTNCHLNISNITNAEESAISAGFSNGTSLLSRRVSAEKDSDKNVTSRPRFSTPLNNDFKIGKSFGNNVNCTSNEFANFFNGFYRSASDRGQKSSSNRDLLKTDQLNHGKSTTRKERDAALPVGAKNYLKYEKKVILGEIEKKCNFQSLFNRNRSSQNEIDEIHETVTYPFCTPRDEQNSVARSLIQGSAIGHDSDEYEDPMFGTKLNDEYSKKEDSRKSARPATKKDTESSQSQNTGSKIAEFTRTQILNDTTKVRELESVKSVGRERVAEESSGPVEPKDIARTTTISAGEEPPKSNVERADESKNDLVKEKEPANTNVISSSSASSLKDRTSLDISTYSEDFEEPTASTNKTKADKNTSSTKDRQLKSTSKELDVPSKDDKKTNKSEEVKDVSQLSVAVSRKSKVEIDYLEKSISFSVIESNKKNKGAKLSRCTSENQVTQDKPINPNKLEKEETNQSEIEEAPIEPSVVDREISEPNKNSSTSLNSRESGESRELGAKSPCKKNDSTEPETELPKNSTNQKNEISCQSRGSKLEEIVNFQGVSLIHSTPKKIMKDSTCANEKLHYMNPDPISSDASRAIDTCAENYSEGELYLPSSCSYSLGEIRISEPGTCCTTFQPDLDSSRKNAEEMNTFVGEISPTHIDVAENSINALNSAVPSPGEVQETDIESNNSS